MDIAFVLDGSGSMQFHIDALAASFPAFHAQLESAGVDVHYAVILYGGPPEIIQTFNNGTVTATTLGRIQTIGGVDEGKRKSC